MNNSSDPTGLKNQTKSVSTQHFSIIQTKLDAADLPVEELAQLAIREGWRPRPIYQAHRWFARRFGSAFRGILTAAAVDQHEDFWSTYYGGTIWQGKTLLDPFVGGGTAVVEAQRFGASVIGVDIDAVACAVTSFELEASTFPDILPLLEALKRDAGRSLEAYYHTVTPEGENLTVLHYFWVQVVECIGCGHHVEAHPHYQLAYENDGTRQWAICSQCHAVQALSRTAEVLLCDDCGKQTIISRGTVTKGKLTCPDCGTSERLIDVSGRLGGPPQWRLFALETLDLPAASSRGVSLAHRTFRRATDYDQAVFQSAEQKLQERLTTNATNSWIPDTAIPRNDRADNRLVAYGYDRYSQLFNARQLLHLSCLAEAIDKMPNTGREAMAIAFSDHLTTNCMMTHYAFGWRRLAPLFSIRAYRHIPRPVEINPWLDRIGRGTFPNAVRQVQSAIAFARLPKEPQLGGGFRSTIVHSDEQLGKRSQATWQIVQSDARKLDFISDSSVDIVLTDPPYFDNIAYSELSDFFLPWLQLLGIVPTGPEARVAVTQNLAAKGRDGAAADAFQKALSLCFCEIARVLKPEGRVVFTFQHRVPAAWRALASAVAESGLRPLQVFPLLGDSRAGLHTHRGSSRWDAVFVMVGGEAPQTALSEPAVSREALLLAHRHYASWARRLARSFPDIFGDADKQNFYRACLTAAALGMFTGNNREPLTPLVAVLKDMPPAFAVEYEGAEDAAGN